MADSRRAIPKAYPYDPNALKPLARTLWSASVSLGHALVAYKQFSRIKSGTISPDGMVGGAGYIQTIEEVRKKLYQACEILSSVSDTLDDEIRAPHWKPKLGLLSQDDAEDVQRFLSDASNNDFEAEAEETLTTFEDANNVKTAARYFDDGGPRVDPRGPGNGPGGSFNTGEWNEDVWPLGPKSNLPTDPYPSPMSYDFGLGYSDPVDYSKKPVAMTYGQPAAWSYGGRRY